MAIGAVPEHRPGYYSGAHCGRLSSSISMLAFDKGMALQAYHRLRDTQQATIGGTMRVVATHAIFHHRSVFKYHRSANCLMATEAFVVFAC
jgi:hypothetical protein